MRHPPSSAVLATVILIAIVGAIAAHFQYQSDMQTAHARLLSHSRIANTPCGPIEYGLAGQGPPLLIVHGAGGGFDQGLEFGEPLVRAGFTVIAPSRFGYLRTPVPRDASPAAQADAHACLLDALGIRKVAAVGGSAGAPSVTQLCLRHPERCSAMILVVPALFVPEPGKQASRPSPLSRFMIRTALRSDFAFWIGSRIAPDSMIESILATPWTDVERASVDERDRALTILQHIEPVSRRAEGLWLDSTVTTVPSQVDFEHISTPTLIVATANDRFGTLPGAKAAARRIPGARLIALPDGGHVWVGHQTEVWSAVVKFLGGIPLPEAIPVAR